MKLLSRLERKLAPYSIPNLTVVLIIGQVFMYLAHQFNAPNGIDVLDKIRLYPAQVLAGEFWRPITFLFVPPLTHLIFAFFFWYLFYLMGSTLEANWGTFRYNFFLLIGYLASLATAFAVHLSTGGMGIPANNGFLYGTVFLAFARLYPDFVLYILFVLPIKIKWLALIQWIAYAYGFILGDGMSRGMIAASVLNFLLFFGKDIWLDMKQGHRRMGHQARALRSQQPIVHKCAVCGLTSEEAPQAQFRYCSKCDGDLCYCSDHLRAHEHVLRHAEAIGERRT